MNIEDENNIDKQLQNLMAEIKSATVTLELNLFGKTQISQVLTLNHSGLAKDIYNMTSVYKKQLMIVNESHALWQASLQKDLMDKMDLFEQHIQICYEFATIVKALFFFVRAYQDQLYRFILNQNSEKDRLSMTSASNPKNPVRIWVDKKAPGYYEWFENFTKCRDKLKKGKSHGVTFKEEGIYIDIFCVQFNESPSPNKAIPEYSISINYIVSSIQWTLVVIAKLNEEFKPLPLISRA